jgi:hypothetical protein
MYFKINHSGCQEHKGLCQIRFDLYLDSEDEKYEDHYVEVPVIPEGGEYQGAVGADGSPIDQKDYDKWFKALPRVWQNNPFCCHFWHCEPEVTDAEILAAGDAILKMAYNNWVDGNLHKNTNPPVVFSVDTKKKQDCADRIELLKAVDFGSVKLKAIRIK